MATARPDPTMVKAGWWLTGGSLVALVVAFSLFAVVFPDASVASPVVRFMATQFAVPLVLLAVLGLCSGVLLLVIALVQVVLVKLKK